MKTIILAGVALLALSAPVSAQILGGAGGAVGGAGSSVGGTLGTGADRTTGSIRSSTDAATRGSASVDRRSGSASASGSATGSNSTAVDSAVGNTTGRSASSVNQTVAGEANAQLVGTDAVRENVGGVRQTTSGAAQAVTSETSMLAARGSAAASKAGHFAVSRGMMVRDRAGQTVGRVQSVATDRVGKVRTLVVSTARGPVTLPATNFEGSGNVLVSAMQTTDVAASARRR
jgi:hypothetical protein